MPRSKKTESKTNTRPSPLGEYKKKLRSRPARAENAVTPSATHLRISRLTGVLTYRIIGHEDKQEEEKDVNMAGQTGIIGRSQDGMKIYPGGISMDLLEVAPICNQDGLQSSGCGSSMDFDDRTPVEGKTTKAGTGKRPRSPSPPPPNTRAAPPRKRVKMKFLPTSLAEPEVPPPQSLVFTRELPPVPSKAPAFRTGRTADSLGETSEEMPSLRRTVFKFPAERPQPPSASANITQADVALQSIGVEGIPITPTVPNLPNLVLGCHEEQTIAAERRTSEAARTLPATIEPTELRSEGGVETLPDPNPIVQDLPEQQTISGKSTSEVIESTAAAITMELRSEGGAVETLPDRNPMVQDLPEQQTTSLESTSVVIEPTAVAIAMELRNEGGVVETLPTPNPMVQDLPEQQTISLENTSEVARILPAAIEPTTAAISMVLHTEQPCSEGVTPPAPAPNLRPTHLGNVCSQAPPTAKTLTARECRDGDGLPSNSEVASLLRPAASTQGKDHTIPDSIIQVNTSLDISHYKRCSSPPTLGEPTAKRQKLSPRPTPEKKKARASSKKEKPWSFRLVARRKMLVRVPVRVGFQPPSSEGRLLLASGMQRPCIDTKDVEISGSSEAQLMRGKVAQEQDEGWEDGSDHGDDEQQQPFIARIKEVDVPASNEGQFIGGSGSVAQEQDQDWEDEADDVDGNDEQQQSFIARIEEVDMPASNQDQFIGEGVAQEQDEDDDWEDEADDGDDEQQQQPFIARIEEVVDVPAPNQDQFIGEGVAQEQDEDWEDEADGDDDEQQQPCPTRTEDVDMMPGSNEEQFIGGEVAQEQDEDWEDEADREDDEPQGIQELSGGHFSGIEEVVPGRGRDRDRENEGDDGDYEMGVENQDDDIDETGDAQDDEWVNRGDYVTTSPVPNLLRSETYKTLKKYPEQLCTNGGLARALEEIVKGQVDLNLQSRDRFQPTQEPVQPKKKQRYFIRRNASQKTLQSEVRSVAKHLLGDQPWKTPSNSELAAFEERPTSNNGPNQSSFCLDFRQGKLLTRWNKQAAKVFAEEFVLEEGAVCTDKSQVEAAFLGHLRTLQKHYQQHCEESQSGGVIDGAAEVKKRDDRFRDAAVQRQYNVLKRRTQGYKARLNDPSIKRMEKEVFPHFTPDVMSGDEEDSSYVPPPRLRCKRFIIRSMVWRNPALVDFCRVLDALYFSLRHLENGKWSRGHFPDERLRCGRTGPGRTVPGLPHNFYNPTWLATLDPLEIEMLDMQPSVDLNFSEEIRRIAARFLGIQNRLSKPLPRGHPSLKTLEGSGPSAQTVANPPSSVAGPTRRSVSIEMEPETRDSHPSSPNADNRSRHPSAIPRQHSPALPGPSRPEPRPVNRGSHPSGFPNTNNRPRHLSAAPRPHSPAVPGASCPETRGSHPNGSPNVDNRPRHLSAVLQQAVPGSSRPREEFSIPSAPPAPTFITSNYPPSMQRNPFNSLTDPFPQQSTLHPKSIAGRPGPHPPYSPHTPKHPFQQGIHTMGFPSNSNASAYPYYGHFIQGNAPPSQNVTRIPPIESQRPVFGPRVKKATSKQAKQKGESRHM